MKYLYFAVTVMLIASCSTSYPYPDQAFKETIPPPKPDYSLNSSWAALPSKEDPSDLTPGLTLTNGSKDAQVDVFYLHPTTYLKGKVWNVDIEDEKTNKSTDEWPLKHQASIFNGSARIFAPRYRQGTLGAFYILKSKKEHVGKTFELAYQDVRESFLYYMEHYNQGRPIIIAGHSQGSMHGMMLLREFFDGGELQEQLVAAYLPGWPVKSQYYEQLQPCNSPGEAGCISSWNTYQWDYTPKLAERYEGAICTNPLNWKSDGTFADQPCSKGVVLRKYDKIYPEACSAQQNEGWLWVTTPKVPSFFIRQMNNYHIADYNLFWMNIRENVDQQVKSYLSKEEVKYSEH